MRKKSKNGKLFSFLPHSSSIAKSLLVMDSPYLSQPPVTDNTFPWESVIRGDAGYLAVRCPATYFAGPRIIYGVAGIHFSPDLHIPHNRRTAVAEVSLFSVRSHRPRSFAENASSVISFIARPQSLRSHGALIRRLVRTGSSPASRYSVVNRGILLSLHLYSFSGRSGAYFYAFAEKFLRYFFIFFPITAIPRETVV